MPHLDHILRGGHSRDRHVVAQRRLRLILGDAEQRPAEEDVVPIQWPVAAQGVGAPHFLLRSDLDIWPPPGHRVATSRHLRLLVILIDEILALVLVVLADRVQLLVDVERRRWNDLLGRRAAGHAALLLRLRQLLQLLRRVVNVSGAQLPAARHGRRRRWRN